MIFWPDIAALQAFYSSSAGQSTCRQITKKLNLLWPHVHGETIAGIGYPAPYQSLLGQDNRFAIFMPAAQGFLHWPSPCPNHTCLTLETSLPLADESIDRVIIAHTLEYSAHPQIVLREIWRVLAPKGKLLVIVPNRLGSWAYSDKVPFSAGNSFHLLQLTRLLQDNCFLPLHTDSLLFTPPAFSHLLPKLSLWEHIGGLWLQPFGGLWVAEAEKQLYSVSPPEKQARNPLKVFMPAVGWRA